MIVKYYGNLAQKIVFTKYKHWKIWILNCYTHSFKLERGRNFDNYDKTQTFMPLFISTSRREEGWRVHKIAENPMKNSLPLPKKLLNHSMVAATSTIVTVSAAAQPPSKKKLCMRWTMLNPVAQQRLRCLPQLPLYLLGPRSRRIFRELSPSAVSEILKSYRNFKKF